MTLFLRKDVFCNFWAPRGFLLSQKKILCNFWWQKFFFLRKDGFMQLLVAKVAQNHPQRVLAALQAAAPESDAPRFYFVKRSPILRAAATLSLPPLRTQCGGFGKTLRVFGIIYFGPQTSRIANNFRGAGNPNILGGILLPAGKSALQTILGKAGRHINPKNILLPAGKSALQTISERVARRRFAYKTEDLFTK